MARRNASRSPPLSCHSFAMVAALGPRGRPALRGMAGGRGKSTIGSYGFALFYRTHVSTFAWVSRSGQWHGGIVFSCARPASLRRVLNIMSHSASTARTENEAWKFDSAATVEPTSLSACELKGTSLWIGDLARKLAL